MIHALQSLGQVKTGERTSFCPSQTSLLSRGPSLTYFVPAMEEQGTVETSLDSPEQPHGDILYLGLLGVGSQFPHPLPMDQTLASQGYSSHTGGHHSTTAVLPLINWGLAREGWVSDWQFIQPSSINHVLNN